MIFKVKMWHDQNNSYYVSGANWGNCMKKEDKVIVSEHILEVRHQAIGRFLDIRGFVADHIKVPIYFHIGKLIIT